MTGASRLAALVLVFVLAMLGCSSHKPKPPPAPAPAPAPVPIPAPPEPARLILHDWFGSSPVCSPSFIKDNLAYLDQLPFDGVAVYMRKADLTDNVTTWIMSDQAVSYDRIAAILAPIKGLHFHKLLHNFAAVISRTPPDFFDNWDTVIKNFSDLARAAREAGLKGIYLDNEQYFAPWANYPDGVKYKTRSLREYQDQAFLRGKQLMEELEKVFPGVVLITLHGPYVSDPKAPSPLLPQAQSSNELQGPLFAGLFAGTKSGLCVDGGELYRLRTTDEFQRAYAWRKETIASSQVDCAFIPPALRPSWAKVSVGFGVYDRPVGTIPMTPEILKTTLVNALGRSDRYVWLYVEGPTFLRPASAGGAADEWVQAVRGSR